MMAEAGAEQASPELHSLTSELACFGSTVTSYSEGSAAMDMCVKTEPDEEDISQPAYCTEVQSFSAEEMDSGLHLDTEHIKTEAVMVKIMDGDGNLQLCSNTEELCPPSQQLNSSTGLLSTQCKSETEEVKAEQHSQLQKPSATESKISEAAHCDIKEECEEIQVNELSTFPSPLSEQCKSETDDVKVVEHCQLEGSSSREKAVNEAEYDLLQRNSATLENTVNSAGDVKYCCANVEGHSSAKCCIPCRTYFSQTHDLKQHQLIHSGKQTFKQSTETFSQLYTSEQQNICECTECRKCFSDKSTLKRHQRVHTGDKPFKCSQCEKSFSLSCYLKKHQVVHSGEKPHKCTECGKSFSRSSTLKQHQVIHSGEKPYKCSDCGKSFSDRGTFKKHQRLHSGEKPYKCIQCEKSFSQNSYLKQHQLVHSGEKPYQCNECGRSYSDRGTLKKHQQVHSGKKPFKCDECGKSFPLSSYLKQHQFFHSGVKPYKCSDCGKSFSFRGTLKKHQCVHSGEKPYKCSQCGKSFSLPSYLKQHELFHSGVKPYRCSQCGKCYSFSGTLRKHQRVHFVEKPYKCSDCGMSFSQTGHLQQHNLSNCGKNSANVKVERVF